MKFSIVTPSYNRTSFLNDTIESVMTQSGDFDIEYIIQDGGSDRNFLDILNKWDEDLRKGHFQLKCNRIIFKWFSEKDNGMYDAINRGFAQATGDIMAWINTDDMYHHGAFAAVSQIFSKFDDVHWITGIPNSFNKNGTTVGFDSYPKAYSREYIIKSYYNVKYSQYGFNWIPQDCVFWRSSLWKKTGARMDETLKQAADFYLWQKFAKHADLVKVYAFLGGYRFHGEQFTANPSDYQEELPDTQSIPLGYRALYKLLCTFPSFRKFIFNKYKGFPILNIFQLKWECLVGRTILWDHNNQEWVLQLQSIF